MKLTAQHLYKFFLGLFILLIPWQTRWIFFYWEIGAETWEMGKLSIYASMIALVLAAISLARHSRKELRFSHNKFLYFVFIYSMAVGFLSPMPAVSIYYLLVVYMAVLFAHLCRFVAKQWLLGLFLFSGVLQSILAIYQSFFQYIAPNKWLGWAEHWPGSLGTAVVELGGERILRAYGALPHPNILGGFLFVAIFCGFYLWINFYQRGVKEKWSNNFIRRHWLGLAGVVLGLAISTYGLLASFSRSAVLALAASLFSVAIINILRRRWLKVMMVLRYSVLFVLVVLSFNAWFSGAWTSRLQVDGRLEEKSINERIGTFGQFYQSNGKDVLFGQGLAMNTKVTKDNNPAEAVYNIQPIHNIFVLALAEAGVVGVLVIIGILRLVIKEADEIDNMSTSLLLGLGVIGLFDHYLWTTWTGWLLLAFGLVNLYKDRPHTFLGIKLPGKQ